MDQTRTIGYIDDTEDLMDLEVSVAVSKSMRENLTDYCKLIRRLCAMSEIDTIKYSPSKSIYYINE